MTGTNDLANNGIEVVGLEKQFKKGPKAVDGISLEVKPGEIYGVLGPTGAGKSTTVHMLTTLLPPTAGTAKVAGFDVAEQGPDVRKVIGAALQEAALDPHLTGSEHMRLQTALHGLPKNDRVKRGEELIERVGLSEAADRRVGGYSGGMKRRLDLALALVHRPRVLVLDEPTTGLDPQSRRATWDLVRILLEERTAVLLTTHYLEEAEALADRIAIMHGGVIAREGTLAEIVARSPTRITFGVDPDAAGDTLDALRRIAGAGFSAEPQDGRHVVRLETFDPQPLLRLLLDWADDRLTLRELRVTPGSLEQAFMDVAAGGRTNLRTAQEVAA